MNSHAEKKQGNQSSSVARNVAQRQYSSNSGSPFVDNRPQAIAQRQLQETANNSVQVKQAARLNATINSNPTQLKVQQPTVPVVQRIVQIGADIYKPYKRGYGIKNLEALITTNQGAATLHRNWKSIIDGYIKDPAVKPKAFNNVQELITHLAPSTKKTQSEKNQEQDLRIQGLNTGFGATELRFGKILSYESGKAFERVTGQVEDMDEYAATVMDLETLTPGARSTSSDFNHTDDPFVNLHALNNADLSRLDFMAPDSVEIDTHGYSSRRDRTVHPNTLNTTFGLGTVQVGPDISSYKREMASTSRPDEDQLRYLNALEMQRFPHLAPQTGMKRELYDQGEFSKNEAMGFNHNHSSVEFSGAVTGSSMTISQRDNMRRQQTLSNYAILQSAYNICPDVTLGQALSNGKHVPTSREEMDALTNFIAVVDNPLSSLLQKHQAKQELRKVLTQILRGVTQMEDIDSEDENDYPTSPYNAMDYV